MLSKPMTEIEHKNYEPPDYSPKIVILINGKRKCGKDYLVNLLLQRLQSQNLVPAVMRIAAPIKRYWSEKHNLDFDKMSDASEYKEQHRLQMVNWSIDVRSISYGYFCYEAIQMSNAVGNPIWICADMRHKEDYQWFLDHYSDRIKRIRITATEEVRKSRGWVYTEAVDTGTSECDLDDVTDWDLLVQNNGDNEAQVEYDVDLIQEWINQALKSSS